MYYDKFKDLCQIYEVRPSDITKATGITSATFSDWKQGKYTPKQDKLQQICDFFGVPLTALTGSEPPSHEEMRNHHQANQLINDFLRLDMEDRRTILILAKTLLSKSKYSELNEIEKVLSGDN